MRHDFLRWLGRGAVVAAALGLTTAGVFELAHASSISATSSKQASAEVASLRVLVKQLKAEVNDHTAELAQLVVLEAEIQEAINTRDFVSTEAAAAIGQIETALTTICHADPQCPGVSFTPVAFTTTTTSPPTTTTTTTPRGHGQPPPTTAPRNLLPTLPGG